MDNFCVIVEVAGLNSFLAVVSIAQSVTRTLALAQCLTNVVNQSIFKRFIIIPKMNKLSIRCRVLYIIYYMVYGRTL